jgi:hypothetical protein
MKKNRTKKRLPHQSAKTVYVVKDCRGLAVAIFSTRRRASRFMALDSGGQLFVICWAVDEAKPRKVACA